MKILVIGDSHGNISNLKHVMGFAKNINAGAVIHTGDWNKFDNIKTVTDFGTPLYSCLGNADIDPRFTFKKFIRFKIDGVKIGIVHSIKNLKLIKNYKLKIKNLGIIFCGHTHKQRQEKKVINPGALENGINFAVFDTETKGVEFIQE